MTNFVGTVMSGFVILFIVMLVIYFLFANGPFLLAIAGFVTVGGVIGYLYGRHETREL